MNRPVPALPFSVLKGPGVVHLIAGEDLRYALRGEGVERVAPRLLNACDGRRTVEELIACVDPEDREAACRLLERLTSERLLIEGPVEAAHQPLTGPLVVSGTGPIAFPTSSCPAIHD